MNKHIALLDLETTGTDVDSARIVQIAAVKLDYELQPVEEVKVMYVNPSIPIPAEASEVHKITDEMVKDAPQFKQIAKSLHSWLQGCDVLGFNSNRFDVLVLNEEFAREKLIWPAQGTRLLDVYKIFAEKEQRTLAGAAKFYLQENHDDAHDAKADILMTLRVFDAQRRVYGDIGAMTPDELHSFCNGTEQKLDLAGKIVRNEQGVAVYSFGKDKGKPVKDNPGFGNWMLKNSFTHDTKEVVRKLLYTNYQ
jgi:DNA polymerase III subunit epsilon